MLSVCALGVVHGPAYKPAQLRPVLRYTNIAFTLSVACDTGALHSKRPYACIYMCVVQFVLTVPTA